MESLFFLKSLVDGFNITLCGKFHHNTNLTKELDCDIESGEN